MDFVNWFPLEIKYFNPFRLFKSLFRNIKKKEEPTPEIDSHFHFTETALRICLPEATMGAFDLAFEENLWPTYRAFEEMQDYLINFN